MLKKFIDLILYSNLFIACCAVAMTWQTQLLLEQKLAFTPLVGLIFCATLVIYALHRVVGMSKVTDFLDVERFHVIQTYWSHILFYAALAVIGGAICFFYLKIPTQLTLIIPGLLSVAYVLPFLGKKREKRLRDRFITCNRIGYLAGKTDMVDVCRTQPFCVLYYAPL